jgi:iron complex outermembrane receptor protein
VNHSKAGLTIAVSAIALSAALAARPALAQNAVAPAAGTPAAPASGAAAQPDQMISEVVVTARQRNEQLRDVPAAVTAFTAASIEAKGIEHPRDFIQSVPNVTLIETQNAGTAFVVIRGISQARNSEPSVAVVVDGETMTNPAAFNQELFDIDQIEVLKGPQGALYGRDAIGGAIIINTKAPTNDWEGSMRVGGGNGGAYKAQGEVSGPITSDGSLKTRTAVSFTGDSGYIENTYLNKPADPMKDISARERLLWTPTSDFTADLRLSIDQLNTQGFYYNIVNPPNVNNTSLPVRVNNPGEDDRNLYDVSLKLSDKLAYGTLSSTTSYNSSREILTGDAFNFLPIKDSLLYQYYGFDLNQSFYLASQYLSQEVRFTSPTDQRFRWITGFYLLGTERFISTGNMIDTGNGVSPLYKAPTFNPLNASTTFLADSQHNMAWASYFDTSTSITDQIEFSANFRYDSDHRRNVTDTPAAFLPTTQAYTGQVREHTWDAFQPQFILRYKPEDSLNLYASYSRGFRSGGFNQTGVGQVAAQSGIVNVGDTFQAETDDSYEVGLKSSLFDHRLSFNLAGYETFSHNGYFFVYLAADSTQNLGNINEVRYTGFDMDATAKLGMGFTADAAFGYTDSSVMQYPLQTRIGEQAPLVSRYTANLGLQYKHYFADNTDFTVRMDYNRIGPTYFWEVDSASPNVLTRNPVDLLNMRATIHKDSWSLSAYGKNITNTIYNAEYSPGGFVFKALPRIYGLELTKTF